MSYNLVFSLFWTILNKLTFFNGFGLKPCTIQAILQLHDRYDMTILIRDIYYWKLVI